MEWTLLGGSFSKVGRFTLFFRWLGKALRQTNEAKIKISFDRVVFSESYKADLELICQAPGQSAFFIYVCKEWELEKETNVNS